ncbi:MULTISPECIES: hypothetical protein [unclassified Photobacterium]|uniref:hypothetical protein n=1 Tax=unclassified Photobacterium TaxID=2628852 RepID=UPI001EDE7596|nr:MULTISPECIES: hypothetical protein [unclassified Photobacterium]MCG3862589.1 hypothetical protein [Photobacterium sp. Ph6]MCG3874120.1 hypothetical protein [Photobacterium sp. Ph5]
MTDLDGFWHAYEVKKTSKSEAAITERNIKIAHDSYNATTTQKGGKYHHLVVFEYNGIIDRSTDNCFNFSTRSSALNYISKRIHNRDLSDTYQNINNLTQGTGKMLYYNSNISVLEYKRQNKLVIYTRLI